MNLSRNFTQLEPGRYQNAGERTVDITRYEWVPDPSYPDDRKKDQRRWTGRLYKADGRTVETEQWYRDDGSLWTNRGVPCVGDVVTLNVRHLPDDDGSLPPPIKAKHSVGAPL